MQQQRMSTEQILREQQREERQQAQERRDRARLDKERQEEAARNERREHQDQYERVQAQRRQQQQQQQQQQTTTTTTTTTMSPAREYELARRGEAASYQQQQLERQRQLEASISHLSPQERKEARIVDWIRGGNPWAEQGFIPMSETQGNREYVSSQRRPGLAASGIAAARLQRSEERISSHRALR